ncbi:hypothetical protein EQV77_02755 [Halobacillus fulvus]|nr:hypothetical protein EQV77_02755 [Halobacillus fulvus]
MKRKSYDDKQIEHLLKELPSIKDKQSKDEVYRKIQHKKRKPTKKKIPWLIPGLASLAVVIVLALMVPAFLGGIQSPMSQMADDSADQTASSGEESSEAESTEEAAPTPNNDQAIGTDEQQGEGEVSTDQEDADASMDESPSEGQMTTASTLKRYTAASDGEANPSIFIDENAQLIIPLTGVGMSEEEWNNVSSDIDEGLLPIEPPYTYTIEGQQATVVFPDQFSISGSSGTIALVESIQWRLYYEGVDQIRLQTESGAPVSLGNYGELEELPVIDEGIYIYRLYESPSTQSRYMIPVQTSATSFEEAIQQLQENQDSTIAPVPANLSVSATGNNNTVQIKIDGEEWDSDQSKLTAIEAILLTAKQFGYSEVEFEGVEGLERYFDLDRPVSVPDYVNPVER